MKVLREVEWNARPEYEKRRMVASIDVVSGKIVKRMAEVEREPQQIESDNDGLEDGEEGGEPYVNDVV